MKALCLVLGGLAIVAFVLGCVLDHCEYKYGRPPRLVLRYEFIGVLVAIVFLVAGIVVGLIILNAR